MSISKSLLLLLALPLMLGLSSCGKKANHVDAPPDVVDDNYPQMYPDPTTDPAATPIKK